MRDEKKEPIHVERHPGYIGVEGRVHTLAGEASVCGECGEFGTGGGVHAACCSPDSYGRFYGVAELKFWEDQYESHGCPNAAALTREQREDLLARHPVYAVGDTNHEP